MAPSDYITGPVGAKTYRVSKSSLRTIIECQRKKMLLSKFQREIPVTIFLVIGSIMHNMIEQFWEVNWKDQASFVNACAYQWQIIFKEHRTNFDGSKALASDGKPIWDFKDEEIRFASKPGRTSRPVKFLKDRDWDYWFGLARIRLAAWVFVKQYWNTPKPPQEVPFDFRRNGVRISGSLDILEKRQSDGKWYIIESKAGSAPHAYSWEATIEILGWGFQLTQDPKLARDLGVPEEILHELKEDPLAAFKYCGVKYFLLYRRVITEPHLRTPAHWYELVQTVQVIQAQQIRAKGTQIYLANRFHCQNCEAAVVCNRYFEETYTHLRIQQDLFGSGIAIAVPKPKRAAATQQRWGFRKRKMTPLRDSRRRRERAD